MKRNADYGRGPPAKRRRKAPYSQVADKDDQQDRQKPRGRREGLGLNTPVHPLLAGLNAGSAAAAPKDATKKKDTKVNPYLTDTLSSVDTRYQKRRQLNFHSHGTFIAQGNELREQQKVQQQKQRETDYIKSVVDFVGGEDKYRPDPPPSCEWWDEPFLVDKSYEKQRPIEQVLKSLIENPKPPIVISVASRSKTESETGSPCTEIVAPRSNESIPAEQMYLTKDEIKRKRKSERMERYKEAQDRIRLGLDPAPPPKIKPSNVMAVYANETIRDPTLMAETARKQAEERQIKHEQTNKERQLTPQQRHEKELAKIERDKNEKGLFCAVFRIDCLADTKHQYQVNIMANELKFTGITVFNPTFSLVIVEGDARNITKYTRYMLKRIKWTELAPVRQLNENSEKPKLGSFLLPATQQELDHNRCMLVWSGPILEPRFNKWSRIKASTEEDAVQILSRFKADQFWRDARVQL